MKEVIKESAKDCIGYKQKQRREQLADKELLRMSTEQKEMRLKIEICTDEKKMRSMRKERNRILKNMTKRMKQVKEEQISQIVKEIESSKDNTRMFKAVKHLKKKEPSIQFVHNDKGECVHNPQAVHDEIMKHFKKHFLKENLPKTTKFLEGPKKLRKEITTEEVQKAIQSMSNNKAPGKDGIPVELLKYACENYTKKLQKYSTTCSDTLMVNSA